MIEKFLVVTNHAQEPSIVTLDGLKRELSTSFFRYFAPVVAIYEQFEKTAGIPNAWQRRKLDEDSGPRRDASH